MSRLRFSHPLSTLALLAAALLLPAAAPAVSLVPEGTPTAGGTDRFLMIHMDIQPFQGRTAIAADSQGRLFAAVRVEWANSNYGYLRVKRSLDGGLTWDSWGDRQFPFPVDLGEPVLQILPGSPEQIVLAHTTDEGGDREIHVSVSRTDLPSATWSTTVAMATAGRQYRRPDVATVLGPNGPVIYVVATAEQFGSDEIHFARSTTSGLTWSAPFVVDAPAVDHNNYGAKIAADDLGRVIVGWHTVPGGMGYDHGVRRRVATSFAALAGNWAASEILGSNQDGIDQMNVEVACRRSGDGFLTTYTNAMVNTYTPISQLVSTSTGPNGPWTHSMYVGNQQFFELPEVLAQPQGGWVMSGSSRTLDGTGERWFSFVRASQTVAPQFGDRLVMSDFSDPIAQKISAAITIDPTRDDRVAMTWVDFGDGGTHKFQFDAEWMADAGVPNADPELDLFSVKGPVTEFVLADLSPRSAGEELVYGNVDGELDVIDEHGVSLPGWPVYVGSFAQGQSPAVGDLDGDGSPEIVMPTSTGEVYVFDAFGALREGWPVVLGVRPAHVSLAAVSKLAPLDVVAVCSDQLSLIKPNGQLVQQGGWPVSLPTMGNHPAALGDLDGDGSLEVVAITGAGVTTVDAHGSVLFFQPLGAGAPTAPASLGDLDGDGDLEIVAASSEGKVFAFDHDGSDAAGFWPISVAGTGSIQGLALANVDGSGGVEVALTRADGVVGLYAGNGDSMLGWPRQIQPGDGFAASPILDDIDGLTAEVLVADDANRSVAYGVDGTLPFGWPTLKISAATVSPATGDMNGDGVLDFVVFAGSTLYVYDLGNAPSVDEFLRWRQFGHDARRTFCASNEASTVVTSVDGGTRTSVVSFAPPAPNPMTSSSQFRFVLGAASQVRVELVDVRGRRVRTLAEGSYTAGEHRMVWDGRDDAGHTVSNGVYFGRLTVEGPGGVQSEARKITLAR